VTTTRTPSSSVTLFRPNGLGVGRGKIYDGSLTIAPEPVPPFQDAQAVCEGESAGLYNRAKPDKPLMNGFAAAFEAMRDTPQLLRSGFINPKKPLATIGNYWLAEQFGWKPLLQDVRNFVVNHFKAKDLLDQLIRDNGKPVRRRVAIAPVMNDFGVSTFTGYRYIEQGFVTQAYASEPVGKFHWTQGYDCWLSGTFRYWLPEGPQDWRWRANMLATIFGLYPSPAQVYKLIPWSWLTDWFTSAGAVVDNMFGSIAERSAADFCYTMCKAWYQRDASVEAQFWGSNSFDSDPITVRASSTMRTETKVRMKSTPFGFGMKVGDLTPMQLSILGALGSSRI
jgi:hypothetical protein